MRLSKLVCFAMACCLGANVASTSQAASSFSDPLTGYSGDSSQAGTQGQLAAGGWDTWNANGASVDPNNNPFDPRVAYDGTGAHFGTFMAGDGGRNYQRTLATDYFSQNFVAKVTVVQNPIGLAAAFFGLGAAGDYAATPHEAGAWGVPDWFSLRSSTFVTPESGALTTFANYDLAGVSTTDWYNQNLPPSQGPGGIYPGPRKTVLRMFYDAAAQKAYYSADIYTTTNFLLGHVAAPGVNLAPLFNGSAGGWPTGPGRIYFGGDDNATFSDFMVTVGPNIPEPTAGVLMLLGLLGLGSRRFVGR